MTNLQFAIAVGVAIGGPALAIGLAWLTRRRKPLPPGPTWRLATNRDLAGPWRSEAEVDVEFYNAAGEQVGTVTAPLRVAVNRSGIVVYGLPELTAQGDIEIAGYRLWVGDEVLDAEVADVPIRLHAGDTYRQRFGIAVSLHGPIYKTQWRPPGEDDSASPQPAPQSNAAPR